MRQVGLIQGHQNTQVSASAESRDKGAAASGVVAGLTTQHTRITHTTHHVCGGVLVYAYGPSQFPPLALGTATRQAAAQTSCSCISQFAVGFDDIIPRCGGDCLLCSPPCRRDLRSAIGQPRGSTARLLKVCHALVVAQPRRLPSHAEKLLVPYSYLRVCHV